jgi:hypothetical protein
VYADASGSAPLAAPPAGRARGHRALAHNDARCYFLGPFFRFR